MIEERKVKAHVCDGCDYDIARVEQQRMTELHYTYSTREGSHVKMTFHFHETDDKHDCLRYWFTGPYVMKRSLERRGVVVETDVDWVLGKLAGDKAALSK